MLPIDSISARTFIAAVRAIDPERMSEYSLSIVEQELGGKQCPIISLYQIVDGSDDQPLVQPDWHILEMYRSTYRRTIQDTSEDFYRAYVRLETGLRSLPSMIFEAVILETVPELKGFYTIDLVGRIIGGRLGLVAFLYRADQALSAPPTSATKPVLDYQEAVEWMEERLGRVYVAEHDCMLRCFFASEPSTDRLPVSPGISILEAYEQALLYLGEDANRLYIAEHTGTIRHINDSLTIPTPILEPKIGPRESIGQRQPKPTPLQITGPEEVNGERKGIRDPSGYGND